LDCQSKNHSPRHEHYAVEHTLRHTGLPQALKPARPRLPEKRTGFVTIRRAPCRSVQATRSRR
jgi:hypothetical protein